MNAHANTEFAAQASRNAAGLNACAAALRQHRRSAARCLSESIVPWEKFAPQLAESGLEAFLEWETMPLVDYLALYCETQDPMWRNHFLGERMKQLHWEADTLGDLAERRRQTFTADRVALRALLMPHMRRIDLDRLDAELAEMSDLITVGVEAHRAIKVLFVGDYLFLDLFNFLAVPLLDLGVTLRPVYATGKNPVELKNTPQTYKNKKFDLVCFSPYSYEFSPQLTRTRSPRLSFVQRRKLSRMAEDAHNQTVSVLQMLRENFDCPIFVHNTANLRRHNGSFSDRVKTLVTSRTRQAAAEEVNALLGRFISEHNRHAAQPLVLVDEAALLWKHGEFSLSRKLYDSAPQHPTMLARELAEPYRELIFAAAVLLARKVIVVDLDNTLWHGTISEGTVQHIVRRQRVLKKLRGKGVLLAIASKGDPENLRWEDALLNERDFIAAEINWAHKYLSIRRMAEEFALKFKDFVFIDDRPDERELVRLSIPGIQCLDATEEASWRMLDWWAAGLPDQVEIHRPHHEWFRGQEPSATGREEEQLLASLGIRVELHRATERQLVRAAELINHSTRFNTCGSRVTLEELESWHTSAGHHVLVATATDKFGSVGLVSVLVVEAAAGHAQEPLRIPLWVMSSRVSGFGIETPMLNYVSALARQQLRPSIRGLFVETAHNEPCREAYPQYGFRWSNGAWELRNFEPMPEASWLEVSYPDATQPLSTV